MHSPQPRQAYPRGRPGQLESRRSDFWRRAPSCRLSLDDLLLFIVACRCVAPAYPRGCINGEDRSAQLLQTFVNLSAHGLLDLAARTHLADRGDLAGDRQAALAERR